jgi:hypothetical protein
MRKDIRKCIAFAGYRIRYADQNELLDILKDDMSHSKSINKFEEGSEF